MLGKYQTSKKNNSTGIHDAPLGILQVLWGSKKITQKVINFEVTCWETLKLSHKQGTHWEPGARDFPRQLWVSSLATVIGK